MRCMEPLSIAAPDYARQSALGMAFVYNMLPSHITHARTVRDFQQALQVLVMERARELLGRILTVACCKLQQDRTLTS